MWWSTGLAANCAVTLAYLGIVVAILRPLRQTAQLRTNRLATATAAIFFSCAVHHGTHAVHMLLPAVGVEVRRGVAMRTSYDWEMAVWDVVTAAVGVYYWTLRRAYTSSIRGAKLFEDLRQREQAVELNDTVLQGLVVAKLAIELGQVDRAVVALDASIGSASRMISEWFGDADGPGEPSLVRTRPAVLGDPG